MFSVATTTLWAKIHLHGINSMYNFTAVTAVKRRWAAEIYAYYHNKRLHVKFGCFRPILKFGGWQLKITGKKWKIGQNSVKEWSNGHNLT